MAVSVTDQFEIEGVTPAQVMQALSDVERIPEWSSAHKDVEVQSRHDDDRPRLVKMTLSMLGVSDTQIAEHTWTGDSSMSWNLVESGVQNSQDGEYVLAETPKGTSVTVTMSVDPKIPLPGLLLKQGQKQAVKTVRSGLTKFVRENYADS